MPSWTKEIRLIAWDLDGTLYPFDAVLNKKIEDEKTAVVATELGLSKAAAAATLDELYQRLKSNTKALNTLGIEGETFFLELWERLDLTPYIHPNPELATRLQEIANAGDVSQVILTNSNTQATVKKKLDLIGISVEVFSAIYTSVEIGFVKPDRRAFEFVLQQQALQSNEVVYIGDREETDIKPAHEVGMRTVLVSNQPQKESVADLQCTSALEATRLFHTL